MKRKLNRKFKKNVHFSIVSVSCIILLFLVLTMSFGFSSYSTSLVMRDLNAVIRYDKNVRVTGVYAGSTSNEGTIEAVDYNVSNIVADIRMSQANSSVTFSVTVKNYGNVEMGIESISLPAQYQNVFDVSITNYTLGDKIRDNGDTCEGSANGCTLNINRTFNVTLTYKNGAYDSNHYLYENVILQFAFKEMHSVTFTGFTILQPTMQAYSAMDGHTYSYNIGPYDQLAVKVGGVLTNDYSIDSNNVITISNVQDDVEIIISEILFNFDITIAPNVAQSGDTIKYVLNGGSEVTITGNGIHLSVPYGSSLTINSIESYGYRTKTNISYNNISAAVNDTITMDQVFYLDVTSDVSGTTFNYTIDGVAQAAITDHLEGEYDPGTVIVVTPSKTNYRSENTTYTYTMSSHHLNESIHMIRQYAYTAIANTPGNQTLMLSVNDGAAYSINSGQTYLFDTGTKIVLTASASGYRTRSITTNSLTSNKTDSVTLTKTYIYTIGTISPSNATLSLKVDGVTRNGVTSGYSEEIDVNSSVSLTVSATGYRSQTLNHVITSDFTQNVTLIKTYIYTIGTISPSNATLSLKVDGVTRSGVTSGYSEELDVNSTVVLTASADYYVTGSQSVQMVENKTVNLSLSMNNSVTVSATHSSNFNLGTSSGNLDDMEPSLPSGARVVYAYIKGSYTCSKKTGTINLKTTVGSTTLWSHGHDSLGAFERTYLTNSNKSSDTTDYAFSYSCSRSNITSCPTGSVQSSFSKATLVGFTVKSGFTLYIEYIPK